MLGRMLVLRSHGGGGGGSASSMIRVAARRATQRQDRVLLPIRTMMYNTSDNITYSGGQMTQGQGGFYGSGGARAPNPSQGTVQQTELVALAADVNKIAATMDEYDRLEGLLIDLEADKQEDAKLSSKAIELRQSIKKLLTSPDFMESLNRLEVKGEPVWGLSSEEREMIVVAKARMNEC